MPRGLRSDHQTRAGVWGRIVIVAGSLRYHVDGMGVHHDLAPEKAGIVVSQLLHRVEVVTEVRFYVEFHRVQI